MDSATTTDEAVRVNRTFHDHECEYYDERFAIVHDARSARQARAEVERLLGRPVRAGEIVLDPGCGTGWQAAGLARALPGIRVVGAGLSAGVLARARALPGGGLSAGVLARARALPGIRVVGGGLSAGVLARARALPGIRVVGGGLSAGVLARARALPGIRVVGADLSAGMLARARAAGAGPLVQADAARLPLAAGSVDLVVTRGVLHHLPDVVAALAEWRRVLRPGGAVVIVSEPTPTVERHGAVLVRGLLPLLRRPLTPTEDFWELAGMAANLHVFTPAGLAAQAAEAGYADARLTTADALSTLVLTASYVVHGRRRGLARRVPWRALEAAARRVDGALSDRLLPARLRHTVVGVLHR